MKLRLCIMAIECGLLGACTTLRLDQKWMFTSLLLIHISFLIHSGYTNLSVPTKKIISTTDFLIDNLDGGIILSFFMGLVLVCWPIFSFRLLGLGMILSGIGFLFALRHIKEFRYQIMLAKQRPISVIERTPTLQEVEA